MPIVLDLFACEGLGSYGYQLAGYEVCAVDLDSARLKYNPADHTLVANAFDVFKSLYYNGDVQMSDGFVLNREDISLLHMSPPCQFYTRGNAGRDTDWPQLIRPSRAWAKAINRPYVIENVKDASWDMANAVGLCGCMFDLHTTDTDGVEIYMQRLRMFETSWGMLPPRLCDHSSHEWVAGAYGGARRDKYEAKYVRKGGYVPPDKDVVSRLMGVKHRTTWKGLFEGLPPAYTEYVGQSFRESEQS